MPIISIIEQPNANDLKAAYRPIVFKVRASRTDGNALPPVVYCDIYINNVFYKTQEKTQYIALNSTNSDWQFDIQDACQEIFKLMIGINGGSSIIEASTLFTNVYCKFRSSGYSTDSFIVNEGTAPIQGTGTVTPVAGTGTQSNTFFVVNATLQHDQNQDLPTHLNSYKNGTWGSDVFPLTHRQNNYRICAGDSDYFSVINKSNEDLGCLVLHYKSKGDSSYSTATWCPGVVCTLVEVPSFSFPHATKDVPYSYSVSVTGTAPFTFSSVVAPGWMIIGASGNTITFSGTPGAGDVADGVTVSVDISNACGSSVISKTIDVAATSCVAVGIVGTPVLPDGLTGSAYSYSFNLSGDAPFTLSSVTKPSWMTIAISGNTVNFSGTPDVTGTGITVSFILNNCSGSTASFSDTINVTMPLVAVSGTINNTGRGIYVTISQSLTCDVSMVIYLTYDASGTPTDTTAHINILAGNTTANNLSEVPSTIICIKPTTTGGTTFEFSEICSGVQYNFSLTITNPC